MVRLIGCITQQHDLRLVCLAVVLCALACSTTLNLIARAQSASGKSSVAWLLAGATVFGFGVWSLHFVAMLAFVTDFPISYGIPTTIASIFLVVVGASIALSVWLFRPGPFGALVGGSLLGLSVSAMHYCGVMAMQMPGKLHFDQGEVAASIVISIIFAILVLIRSRSLASYWRRIEAAGWLALSVFGLHFTGMAALSIELASSGVPRGAVLSSETLAVTVGTVSLAILIVSMAATLMEQRLSKLATLELQRLRLLSDMSEEFS